MFADIFIRSWSFAEILIAIIVIAAAIAILYVALKEFGVQIPAWVIRIGWIVAVACLSILAIRLVLSM